MPIRQFALSCLLYIILYMFTFFWDHAVVTFVSSFFTVVGGTAPVVLLIYFFSKQEKQRLQTYADELEKTLPIQDSLLKKMSQVIQDSITPENLERSAENFKKLVESTNLVEGNKKFIKYARGYNFISAVGQILRMSNYMPKNLDAHKEFQ